MYRAAFRAYASFTGMTASSLIDEALADLKKDPRERQDVVLTRLVKFYQWLKTEYPKKTRGMAPARIRIRFKSFISWQTYIHALRVGIVEIEAFLPALGYLVVESRLK